MEPEPEESVGLSLESFTEKQEVLSLLDSLPSSCVDLRVMESAEERFTVILDKYQEQPHLLDPHLGFVIPKLLSVGRQEAGQLPSQQAFRYLYLVSKVRGPKVALRWFSHEVSDLEPVLSLLEKQSAERHEGWETRYVLLLWLSIIVMVPFNLRRLDGHQQTQHLTIDRIFHLAKVYVQVTDKSRDAAAMLLARFLGRPDVRDLKMAEFVDWALKILASADVSTMKDTASVCGVLATLAALFKHSKREEMVSYAPQVLTQLKGCNTIYCNNTLIRKFAVKLAQRLGTTYLPARVLSWRYQRGQRSLEEALAGPTMQASHSMAEQERNGAEEEGWDVPEEVEDILELLLSGLRDGDTVVRWSAAKGVGRVAGRLPRELADEVLHSLLQLFSVREGDAGWHGGCLALAELGRRGLLLPERLQDVVPVVLKALVYDEKRGTYSVGAHVRDAACYVCWSFARAYDPKQLKPFVQQLASGLVIATLFDREVNCRRAAAAAFQENVGRQGTFPHGIDILTTADYFAVGSRSNTFLNLSKHVAQYSEYTQPLIDHLVQKKLGHWDSSLRELAAESLYHLTARAPAYMRDQVLPSLIPLVMTSDPWLCHGALHAVSEITSALYHLSSSSSSSSSSSPPLTDSLDPTFIQQLIAIIPTLEGAEVFRGVAGETMRPAALKFIERMCGCRLPVLALPVLGSWQNVIDSNITHTEEYIREAAVSALHAVCSAHYSTDLCTLHRTQDQLIGAYIAGLSSTQKFARMGYCLALGALPRPFLSGQLQRVLEGLVGVASNIQSSEASYTEARRDAVKAIIRLYHSVGVAAGNNDDGLSQSQLQLVYETFIVATRDYTTDARGDIGVVVREAAVAALKELSLSLALTHPSFLIPHLVEQMMCSLIQQANEKIDRMRGLACSNLVHLIHCKPPLPHIPHHAELAAIIDQSELAEVNWAVAQSSFPVTVQLLALSAYRYHTLLGLVASVGGLTESTVRSSSAALLGFLKGMSASPECLEPFTATILEVFRKNKRNNRVTLPLLRTLDLLLSNSVFDVYLTHPSHSFPADLLSLVNQEIARIKYSRKLLASIDVFCGLLQFSAIRMPILNQIMSMLQHTFPTVRRTTADQFYAALITYDDLIPEEVADDVTAILSETVWEGDVKAAEEATSKLCDLLALPRPVVKERKSAPAADKLDSYRDLVDRVGY